MTQISSLTPGYQPGMLSVYPEALDDDVTLYSVKNNASSTLKQSLSYNAQILVLNDGSNFPNSGIVRIGPAPGYAGKITTPDGGSLSVNGNNTEIGDSELIFYGSRNGNVLSNLLRGFAGSRQGTWIGGTYCTCGVMAEHHNAVKDAVINIEQNLGISNLPTDSSLNGILKAAEREFLAPKPTFRAVPRQGSSPLRVRFQNFSGGDPIRYLWDFGDGSTSTEISPIHTYNSDGIYTVKLNVITSLGAQGVAVKSNYITVDSKRGTDYFYVSPTSGNSTTTNASNPTTFTFVDQSDGPIVERIWDFGDGNRIIQSDPNIHDVTHVYGTPGSYDPILMIVFDDTTFNRISYSGSIQVS